MDAFLYTTYVQGALPWDKPMSIASEESVMAAYLRFV
jgi:hypothetical protein